VLRAAVARVGRDELKAALVVTGDPRFQAPVAVTNALNALRKRPDPVGAVLKPPYRAALPYVAAAIADACLARTIEELGDHSDDPTMEQLLEAVATVLSSDSPVTVAVMLASVAAEDMPASDLCFRIVTTDERLGLVGTWATASDDPDDPHQPVDGDADPPGGRVGRDLTPEQRQARRDRRQREAETRRRKAATARRAGEQVRRARKERTRAAEGAAAGSGAPRTSTAAVTPRLTRRAALTPLEESEFDRDDPWAGGVVFAWVPFVTAGPAAADPEGKVRPCVVVAGSATHLLVRPGYSEGGTKSRDWRAVPVGHWRRSGFDRPTWIDIDPLRVPRAGVEAPAGRLTPEDWNALW
jgi:hypothetical protein